jgi:hypothetical protein
MIRVKVELEPYGMTINGKSLAEIRIWNTTGKGFAGSHSYEYEIYEPEPLVGKPIIKKGGLSKYNRQQPVVELLKAVLNELDNP